MSLVSDQLWQQHGVANCISPAWTPGLGRAETALGTAQTVMSGRAAHRVGMHRSSEGGVESGRVDELQLPVRKDKRRADEHVQSVHNTKGSRLNEGEGEEEEGTVYA